MIAGTAIHVLALVADSYLTFGAMEILVPMTSRWRPTAVSFGVAALYLLVAIHVSSLLMKRISKRTWRGIHSLSALLVWCAVVHGALAGTDAANPVSRRSVAADRLSVSAGLTRIILGRGGQRRPDPPAANATADASSS